jgi:hypothetical protein
MRIATVTPLTAARENPAGSIEKALQALYKQRQRTAAIITDLEQAHAGLQNGNTTGKGRGMPKVAGQRGNRPMAGRRHNGRVGRTTSSSGSNQAGT